MKKLKLFICLLLLVEGNHLIAQKSIAPSIKAQEYLSDFRAKTISAMMKSSPEILEAYYSDSIRVMPELQKSLLGKNNAAAYSRAFLERFQVKNYQRSAIEISDLGSQILEIGEMSMTLVLKGTGEEFDIKGAYFDLWLEQANGDLKLLTQCWNYDQYYTDLHPHLAFHDLPGTHIALLPNINITDDLSLQITAYGRFLDAVVTEHNAVGWAQFYSDDAMLVTNYHPPYKE